MKKMFVLLSHELTKDQIESAREELKCREIVYFPERLQEIWKNIPAEQEGYSEIEKFQQFILKNFSRGDIICIQGEWGYTHNIVNFCKGIGVVPVYAATKRECKEIKREDGSVVKVSRFKHVRFKKY